MRLLDHVPGKHASLRYRPQAGQTGTLTNGAYDRGMAKESGGQLPYPDYSAVHGTEATESLKGVIRGHPLGRVSAGKEFVVPNVFSFLGSSRCCCRVRSVPHYSNPPPGILAAFPHPIQKVFAIVVINENPPSVACTGCRRGIWRQCPARVQR